MREISLPLPHSHLTVTGMEWNEKGKTTVLALHGWLDNAASFVPLAPLLKDVHLIAIDWPGHGHASQLPLGVNYHFVDYIVYLHECFTALERESMVVVGHSLGAAVASLFAGCFPEMVSQLILLEGLGPLPMADDEAQHRLRDHVQRRLALRKKEKSLHASVEKAVRARLMATPMLESSARLIVERNLQETPGGLTWRTDQRLTLPSPQRFSEPQVINILSHITSPTLLLTGSEGLFHAGKRFSVEKRIGAIKKLQHRIVPGNHHLHMDAPESVATAINEFLDAHN